FPQHAHYFRIEGIRAGKNVMHAHNLLLGRFAGADGMKTGFICASGFNLVGSATRNGRTLIAVVLGATSQQERAEIAAQLLEDSFRRKGGVPIRELPRQGANLDVAPDLRPLICTEEA